MNYLKAFILLGTLVSALHSALLISPIEAMQQSFGIEMKISKKNHLLSRKIAAEVQQEAKVKLTTKIYRVFKASKENVVTGYGVLITRKVRSKDAAVLYLITPDGILKGIEIVAFHEPSEFIPSKRWIEQFESKSAADPLRVGKDIPTISGATLSARNITESARIALSVFQHVIKNRP